MTKKDVLFWTLMAIFIATAIVALGGMVGVVPVKEGCMKWLMGGFLGETVGAVVALVKRTNFFDDHEKSEVAQQVKGNTPEQVQKEIKSDKMPEERTIEKVKAAGLKGPSSAEEYFETLDKLKGRFAEKSNYIEIVKGSEITWVCVVVEASRSSDNTGSITLRTRDTNIVSAVYLNVPNSCLLRALSLRTGDYIRFTCKLDNGISCAPHLKADDFELVDKEAWGLPKKETADENVVTEPPFCFKIMGEKRQGPFCMKCHILDNTKLVPLSPWGKGQWKCQVCDTMFYDKDYVKPKAKAPRYKIQH